MINPQKVYRQDISVLNFYGQDIPTVMMEELNTPAVFAKPLVENLGILWNGQHAKLMENPRFQAIIVTVKSPDDDQAREHIVLPIRALNAFLFSINPQKVPADKFMEINGIDVNIRENLIKYQDECTVALHDYWLHGMAINTRENPSDVRSQKKMGPVVYSRGRIERVLPKFLGYAETVGQPLDKTLLTQNICVMIAEYIGAIAYNPEKMTVTRLVGNPTDGMQKVEEPISGRDLWLVAVIENVWCNAMTDTMHNSGDITEFLQVVDTMILATIDNLGHHFIQCASTFNNGNGFLSSMA